MQKYYGLFLEEKSLYIKIDNAEIADESFIREMALKSGFSTVSDSGVLSRVRIIVAIGIELTKNIREHSIGDSIGEGLLIIRRYEKGLEIIAEDKGKPVEYFYKILNDSIKKGGGLKYASGFSNEIILQSSEDWLCNVFKDTVDVDQKLQWKGNRIVVRFILNSEELSRLESPSHKLTSVVAPTDL